MAYVIFFSSIGLMLVGFVLSVIWLYKTAKAKEHASFVREGTMEFKMTGEDLTNIFVNSDGYSLTTKREIKTEDDIVRDGDTKVKTPLLARLFGLWWVSWFHPWVHIHRFKISKKRIRDKTQVSENAALRERIEDEEGQIVNHLRHVFVRPFFIEGAETQDGLEPNVLAQGKFRVVRPAITIFKIGGRFFEALESMINTRVADYIRQLPTYKKDLLKTEMGDKSAFSKFVMEINPSLLESLGIVMDDFWGEEVALSAKDHEAAEAIKALEKQTLQGEADIASADAKKQVLEKIAAGENAGNRLLAETLAAHPDVAREVADVLVSQNLGQNSNLSVVSFGGGGNTGVMVDTSRRNAPPGRSDSSS